MAPASFPTSYVPQEPFQHWIALATARPATLQGQVCHKPAGATTHGAFSGNEHDGSNPAAVDFINEGQTPGTSRRQSSDSAWKESPPFTTSLSCNRFQFTPQLPMHPIQAKQEGLQPGEDTLNPRLSHF